MKRHNEETAVKARKSCRKLVNLLYKSRGKVIIGDEKYFCFDGDNMVGSARYYTKDKTKCSVDVRFI